jgi:hypothetical protein
MRGIIFTEFLEMVEEKFGYGVVDEILTEGELTSGGIYSSVGTYDHKEIFILVHLSHEKSGIPIPNLMESFGEYLFASLVKVYRELFEHIETSFDMLNSLEGLAHNIITRLYPDDDELPTFRTVSHNKNQLVLDYSSEWKMSDAIVGLMRGCFKHFNEEAQIEKYQVSEKPYIVRFTLTKM